ncbi:MULTISPECIES: MmcQ/YjbR family DNA-binding protein [Leeuwenhoekiella]|jgi:predicted DNA-binding protein (MmcQ/YjbR family)|uniref:MmcQ/YjbR family DNA-binding protein n=1 Tax=Leeuwenhoekiella TaxID=283735 RepID=UPI000C564E74|nr:MULTISPECIES: MmcQ/YjbR family DNA-binding protein [Leeuwenhoekiella]MAO42587.1 MmcQ-like protein [Leeuwenhoekiella sp.]MBQ51911.1 MmcQ-like protein [Leeuwenhoekiella sp.]HBT08714.1 MmcQ-like protein [Leeuwenhoekiella sp.]HCW64993.1 MmcQ-like protein [Leeuwenhoekiella sp.]|tara:strand:+ start:3184 stop:3555 length:372 start_codon:yes stop_codon:yes gene_type:complete
MNIESYREYCLQKPGTTEHFPFNEDTLVFKVMGKMYALSSLMSWENGEPRINLKCDPEEAILLREKYPESVLPGYHMNKQLWNTVVLNGELTPKQVQQFIDDSYTLIVNSLTKKLKEELKRLD